jgi:uncharacterized protein YyaL (SSP411 family)
MDFLRRTMWRHGRLLATAKDGRAHLDAYLDDHAFLLTALLELMQAEFRDHDLVFAVELADSLLTRFEDPDAGGFFFTAHDHEVLIHRPKTGHDNATPAGNGVAAFALQRLGHLLGEGRYLDAAEKTLRLFWPQIRHSPTGLGSLLGALEEALTPPDIIILRGPALIRSGWCWPCPTEPAVCLRRSPSRKAIMSTPGYVAALLAQLQQRISRLWFLDLRHFLSQLNPVTFAAVLSGTPILYLHNKETT